MSRLIDADNLLKQYERIDWYSVSKEGQFMRGATTEDNPFIHYYDGEEIIKNAPTVDAVEVVRCRECKHLNVVNRKEIYAHCPKTNTVFLPFDLDTREHFCSLGERKEGAENEP